jgi:ketosteroid isomerase-like protein
VELVRQLWDAFQRRDAAWMVARCTEDLVIVQPVDIPDTRTYTGPAAVAEMLGDWPMEWEDFRAEPAEISELTDDIVLSVSRNRGRGRTSGVAVDIQVFYVHHMRDGKMARLEMFFDRAAALKAVGLEE